MSAPTHRPVRLRTLAQLRREVRQSCMTSTPKVSAMTRQECLDFLGEDDPTPEQRARGIEAVSR